MTRVIVPFLKVATFDNRRQPNIKMNEEIHNWMLGLTGWAQSEWLIGMNKNPKNWKVSFNFRDSADALMFKLTFGGA